MRASNKTPRAAVGARGSRPRGVLFGTGGVPDTEAAQVVGEVVERLTHEGLPQGFWLMRIEQALVGVIAIEALLRDLHDAIIDQYAADEHDPP